VSIELHNSMMIFCKVHLVTVNLTTYGKRAFSYAGPSEWNCLKKDLRISSLSYNTFKRQLKIFLMSWAGSASSALRLFMIAFTLHLSLHYITLQSLLHF